MARSTPVRTGCFNGARPSSAARTRYGSLHGGATTGFNGARRHQSRVDEGVLKSLANDVMLQRSAASSAARTERSDRRPQGGQRASTERGLIGRENAPPRRLRRAARACFNGARPDRPREHKSHRDRSSCKSGFNGAWPDRQRERDIPALLFVWIIASRERGLIGRNNMLRVSALAITNGLQRSAA